MAKLGSLDADMESEEESGDVGDELVNEQMFKALFKEMKMKVENDGRLI